MAPINGFGRSRRKVIGTIAVAGTAAFIAGSVVLPGAAGAASLGRAYDDAVHAFTIRQMARELSLDRDTVNTAYREALAEENMNRRTLITHVATDLSLPETTVAHAWRGSWDNTLDLLDSYNSGQFAVWARGLHRDGEITQQQLYQAEDWFNRRPHHLSPVTLYAGFSTDRDDLMQELQAFIDIEFFPTNPTKSNFETWYDRRPAFLPEGPLVEEPAD